jgi:type I restriction enzyme, S subunit
MNKTLQVVKFGKFLRRVDRFENRDDFKDYSFAGTYSFARGIFVGAIRSGSSFALPKVQRIKEGDFVYCKIMAWEGAFGIVPRDADDCVLSGAFVVYEIDRSQIEPRFLEYFFRIRQNWNSIGSQSMGTNVRRRSLHPSQFENSEILLPPIEEQRRIVARIEELSAKIEEARRLRGQCFEEADALANAVSARTFAALDNVDVRLVDEICEVRGGIQKSSVRTPGANPRRYITVAHVQRNRIDTSDPRFFEVSDAELELWRLLPGDVLVIEGNGSEDQIGRAALFNGQIKDCVHQNHVIRVRPNSRLILPEYLNTYFNSPVGRDQMLERSRTTSGLFNLSVGRIKNIEIPLPPLPEQRRMVAYLDHLQSKADVVKKFQDESEKELNALMPSILSRAFSGEL